MRRTTSNPYEDMIKNAEADLERAYLESMKSFNDHSQKGSSEPPASPTLVSSEPFVSPENDPTSCIICTEDFSGEVRPPPWISLACLHEPSVCLGCLSKYIKHDLKNKIWNQLSCPECKALLIYEDIKRLADSETFAKYEQVSFRSAVGTDTNFVWCRGCDFGQLHESGASQPIIRCLKCGLRSCFVHGIAWHARLTCEEYDEMIRDPEGFKSELDKEDEEFDEAKRRQDEEDERLARSLMEREKLAEEGRQRQRHAEAQRQARAEQEAQAARKKREIQVQEIRKRQQEEKMSLATVKSTTKQCPGCQWPIQKNQGCSHMTCESLSPSLCEIFCSCLEAISRGLGYQSDQVTD
ncbi:hypothetical protein BJ875DRAFT_377830 [Amylocarpus encephaloides]|uniref:RBR-type E3 ubiquitin transferase n=1 Tax=Amylocarpus encephaloides TaxID=45428 RepID=A0A9P8C4R8_9HELO|nr:hypothetical protein BJ875DRAFT_377830 [Amylocarpus encephaloides]